MAQFTIREHFVSGDVFTIVRVDDAGDFKDSGNVVGQFQLDQATAAGVLERCQFGLVDDHEAVKVDAERFKQFGSITTRRRPMISKATGWWWNRWGR